LVWPADKAQLNQSTASSGSLHDMLLIIILDNKCLINWWRMHNW